MRAAPRVSVALALSVAVVTGACGLPDEERTRTVETDVPYLLLEPAAPSSRGPAVDPSFPRGAPVVLWVRRDGKLVPAPVDASCADAPSEVVDMVLETLSESATTEQRDAGWSSALPPSARIELVEIADGIARVDVDLTDLGDPERLPSAVGQLVLSVTSVRSVEGLELTASGETIEAPLPGGALTEGPLAADDYVQMLPRRLRDTGPQDLGCQ